MKTLVKVALVLLVLGVGGAVAYPHVRAYWKERNKPHYRQAEVTRGNIVAVVNSTGTVQPKKRVQIGTFVSGPIEELNAYFNDEVTKGQLLAKIDPRLYEANVARDRATLATRKAEVARVKALLQQAINDEQRAIALRAENEDYLSATEMDQYKYNRLSLQAQLEVASAAVEQALANLEMSETNLEYTEITSPEDGIIIDCKIEEGQTMAAQFQTPELFIVAPNMREEIHILASVDEADIGLIRKAQEAARKKQKQEKQAQEKQGREGGKPEEKKEKDEEEKGEPGDGKREKKKQREGEPTVKVHFTVDAYPDDLFEGRIFQVRMNSTILQNVVSYPVVVAAENPDLKLLPGMTASLSFEIDQREDVVRIPNAALRFYPKTEQVRPEDRKLLEGTDEGPDSDNEAADDDQRSAIERAEANRRRNRRHVWVLDGELLRAVEVVTGLNNRKWTEMVSGELKVGQKLVTRVGPPGP